MGKVKSNLKRKRNHLVFDNEDRKDYLSGFCKRKQERKLKAKEKLENDLRQAKIRLRKEKRDAKAALLLDGTSVPEIQHLVEPVTYDFPEKTLTISSMDTNEIGGLLNVSLGNNKFAGLLEIKQDFGYEQQEENSIESKDENENIQKKKILTPKELKRKHFNELKKDKAYRKKEKMKRIKDLKKAAAIKKLKLKKKLKNKKKNKKGKQKSKPKRTRFRRK